MTLDEAIQHCKEQVQEQAKKGCYSCAEEHQQLVEWLKELKVSRSENPNTCGDAVSRAIVQEEITKSIELKENPYQLWYRIQALPSVTPQPCGDAISRQAAISAIEALQLPIMREASTCYQFKFSGMSEAKEAVENLPSVTPQQRTGRWIKQNYGWNWQCSECGFVTPPSAKEIFTFCPKCGCKMQEVEE